MPDSLPMLDRTPPQSIASGTAVIDVVVGIDPGPMMGGIGVLMADTGAFVGWRVIRNEDKFSKLRGGFDPARDTDALDRAAARYLAYLDDLTTMGRGPLDYHVVAYGVEGTVYMGPKSMSPAVLRTAIFASYLCGALRPSAVLVNPNTWRHDITLNSRANDETVWAAARQRGLLPADADDLPRGQRTHVADAVCIADWTRGWRKMAATAHGEHGKPHVS